MQNVLGLDVGGANLKAAHTDGTARLQPFALWQQPQRLKTALRELIQGMPAFDRLALTMTGELCDCYRTGKEGVLAIFDAVEAVADGHPVRVWRSGEFLAEKPDGTWYARGEFVRSSRARESPLSAAAKNWYALATYAGRLARKQPALLIDVGSTTTDLIPLSSGLPEPKAHSDPRRLRSRELVYTGARRTPVCSLLQGRVAAEWFATTRDVYLVLEEIPEEADTDTADGRPATRQCAHSRLARMLCADGETCAPAKTRRLAEQAAQAQLRMLRQALRYVLRRFPAPPPTVILSGSGEFLGRKMLVGEPNWFPRIISLRRRLGPILSSAACAYAVAVLEAEGNHADWMETI